MFYFGCLTTLIIGVIIACFVIGGTWAYFAAGVIVGVVLCILAMAVMSFIHWDNNRL